MSTRTAIVVGAGSAGAVVARRLIDAGVSVTLLEAGGEDTNPAIHDPSRMGELWHSEDDWDYRTVPQEHAAGRRLHLPRGKVLGGSHALNAMIWVRCAPADFDAWAAQGNTGWAWKDVLPVYKAIEDFSGGESELHGVGGPLPVTDDYELHPIQRAIMDAAVEEGLPLNEDYNGESLEGVSQQQVTMRDGVRANTWTEYLKPVRDRLDILVGAHVHSVLIEDGRAVGVRYRFDGEYVELRADEVVLAAGALDSPPILMRSGIGPADELSALGIDVVRDAPGVGKNLHDHFLAPVIFTTTKREVGPPQSGMSVTQSHHFWTSLPELPVPDTQPIHFSVPMYGEMLEPRGDDGFSLMAGIVTPKSRGTIALSGPGLDDPVLIDPQVLADEDDVRSMVASVRKCRAIGRQPALADEWGAEEIYPGPDVADDEVEDYVRRTIVTYHHQVGTCRMGVDDEAVVDPRLKVHGIEGLRVIDASIMPTVTTGNTNAPAVLIGELGARFMLEDLALTVGAKTAVA
ncbi:GMC family oxidoreductase [Demequina zhanjiangensis]|uniref:GMC family oxidoreductase N-terminal domain-containing protein n=1 Tax=Demequina zhanjiangensis TaxID=3051659 RepID=A0ABT8G4E2_9MICO|nr:GMC family oxidoreductase N-terminal domain-containing protein [Demequina sp. SYSU T00b26]MDN4474000.1 GMC family oxidoreductase N-terminal domain-containing protein [Demequina sp. SYSU T00b26]